VDGEVEKMRSRGKKPPGRGKRVVIQRNLKTKGDDRTEILREEARPGTEETLVPESR